ncbi:MAG: polyamine aminopropyltransferase [Pseudomonadota bacterium]
MNAPQSAEWVIETVNDAAGFRTALKAQGPVRTIASAQDLKLFRNPTFGSVMMLDGAVQITSADEFIYHEMMAHVPATTHPAPQTALVIGGGDGGILRELLRHPTLTEATLVEIDQAVIDLSKEVFAEVSAGAFDDPRVTVVIADGARFLADTRRQYDLIIVDSPDPVGSGAVLFEREFYQHCASRLAPGGVLVTQSGMPFLTPDWFAGHSARLRGVFPLVSMFLSTIPSYTGGPMAHSLCRLQSAAAPAAQTLAQRAAAIGGEMRYWSPQVHAAAFALPPYIAALVQRE